MYPKKQNNFRPSRREFLKGAAASAGAALIGAPGTVRAAMNQEGENGQQELATVLDLSKCVGCGACVEACRETNAPKFPQPHKPFPTMYPSRVPVEDWSDRRAVDDRLTPYNWLFIQSVDVEWNGETHEIHVPRRCLHCTNPPCANLCPWGAARREATGVVRIDEDICLGGAKCRTVCPWHIPQRQTGVGLYLDLLPSLAGNGVMYKCDRCYDRPAKGEMPACIEACPMDVQHIGPRDEILAEARELAKAMNGYIYGAEENGGTNTFYVSPVPFERIDAALSETKGKGRPHLAHVENKLDTEQTLARAVFLAPVAGIVAGVAKAVKAARTKEGA